MNYEVYLNIYQIDKPDNNMIHVPIGFTLLKYTKLECFTTSVLFQKCSCSPEPQPNRRKVCTFCGKEFPPKKKARLVKGRVNPSEQAEHMKRRVCTKD